MIRTALSALRCIAAVLLASQLQIHAASAAEEIQWSRARKLTWQDFQGSVDLRAPREHVAATASSLSWTYQYETEFDAKSCSYRLIDVHAAAIFDPKNSWVKPGHRTANVLQHEQGHFDITEIHRRMFDAMSAALAAQRHLCSGTTRKQVGKFIDRDIAASLGALYDKIWRDCLATQQRYDTETRHGENRATQTAWTEKIERGLSPQGWRAFAN